MWPVALLWSLAPPGQLRLAHLSVPSSFSVHTGTGLLSVCGTNQELSCHTEFDVPRLKIVLLHPPHLLHLFSWLTPGESFTYLPKVYPLREDFTLILWPYYRETQTRGPCPGLSLREHFTSDTHTCTRTRTHVHTNIY